MQLLSMACIFQFAFCLLNLDLCDAYDYEKDWPTTEKKKDASGLILRQAENTKILTCKAKCPQDNAGDILQSLLQADPGEFIKADYNKFCPSATKSIKCVINCYPKDDKYKKLNIKLDDFVANLCSPGYMKHLACYKTLHDDKNVASCMAKCASKPPAKNTPVYESLPAVCQQMECQSKCEKQGLLTKCKMEGKDAYARYIKKKIHLLKSLAWGQYHMAKQKRIHFNDVCDNIAY